jgi:hypothetical protein
MYFFICVTYKEGGWKNDSQRFADDSHFGQGFIGWELFFQSDGQLWELAIKLLFNFFYF